MCLSFLSHLIPKVHQTQSSIASWSRDNEARQASREMKYITQNQQASSLVSSSRSINAWDPTAFV